jgi:cell division protein FtsW
VPWALVLVQPDLGTASMILFGGVTVMFLAGVPLRYFLIPAGAIAVAVPIVYQMLHGYQRKRIDTFLDPESDPLGAGYHITQSQIAIGSGGMFGVGPGQSVQKVFYLPEAHTDFILAVIGEELGLAGICGLLALYGMIGYAGLRTAKAAKGAYAKLLAAGLTSLILCQALLNIYTVLGLAPLTGVPLPFISSGSTSLITLLMAMGLLLNVAGGGSVHLRAVRGTRKGREADERAADRDRGRRDRGTRGARHRGGRRAAG